MVKLYDAPLPPFQLTDIQIQHSFLLPPPLILVNVYYLMHRGMLCFAYYIFICVYFVLRLVVFI